MNPEAPILVGRLRAALDGLGDALARADLEALLASEPAVAEALDAVAGVRPHPGDAATRREIERARTALLRCRRLGASLADVARMAVDPADACGYVREGGRRGGERATTIAARG